MLNFDFLENGQGIISPPHFTYDFFSRVICYKLTKFLCLIVFTSSDVRQYAIVCFPGYDVINFEINLVFPVKDII